MASDDANLPSDSKSQACAVCTLLINWSSTSKTANVISTFISSANGISETAALPKSICAVCLGILERSFSERVIDEMIRKFDEFDCDSDTFNLAITLPPSCLLREKLSRPQKKIETPVFVLSLKDACRLCYQAGLEQRLASKKIVFDGRSDLTIAVTFDNPKADECCSVLQRCFPDRFPTSNGKRKRRWADRGASIDGNNSQWSRSTIIDVLPSLTPEKINAFDMTKILQDHVDECSVSIDLSRTPLFIGGRYCKYSRYLTQTPWMVDGVRRGTSSVQGNHS